MTDSRGVTTITYDAQNRPTLITAPSGRQHELTYDGAGNVIKQSVHRSTSTGQKLVKSTRRFFDVENRLYASYTRDARGRLLASLSYAYDENGNPTHRRTGSSDQRFAYDALNQIKEVAFASGKRAGQADTYAYDAAGNRQAKNGQPYAYNALGQLTSAPGPTTYSYDPQGRRTARSTLSGTETYSFDAFDQLSQSTSREDRTTTYAHDALGRLTGETMGTLTRTYNYAAGDSPSTITSTQAGPESSLTRSQRLTYGPGGLIESQIGGAAPTYPEADNVGTITAWTNEQGSVTQEPELDPFGELVGPQPDNSPSPVDESPLTFTGAFGRQALSGSNLVKMGARVYDPEASAFISRDPVTGDPSEPARRVPYAYAFNGPGRYLDLDGQAVIPSLEQVSDFVAGFGDAASVGGSARIRLWINGGVDPANRCSWSYTFGDLFGTAAITVFALRGSIVAAREIKTLQKFKGIIVLYTGRLGYLSRLSVAELKLYLAGRKDLMSLLASQVLAQPIRPLLAGATCGC